jgi:hypothetical protein
VTSLPVGQALHNTLIRQAYIWNEEGRRKMASASKRQRTDISVTQKRRSVISRQNMPVQLKSRFPNVSQRNGASTLQGER